VNFAAGQTTGNMALAPIATDGTMGVCNGSPRALHITVDHFGVVSAGPATAAGTTGVVSPYRVLDARLRSSALQARPPRCSSLPVFVAYPRTRPLWCSTSRQ
jgi:hypothetical protein